MSRSKLYVGCTVSHNCSVAVVDEKGQALFALHEERLSRRKLHIGYPWRSLELAEKLYGDYDWVFCFARLGTFRRILRTIHFQSASRFKGIRATPLKPFLEKFFFQLTREQQKEDGFENAARKKVDHFVDHHFCHAASAYYQSGLPECEVVTLDGMGNYYSCTFSEGKNGKLTQKAAYYHNDVTIGNDYEVVTALLGFDPLRHAGKITGLAAYGEYNEACIDTLDTFLKNNWNGKETSFYLQYFNEIHPQHKQQGLKRLHQIRAERFKDFSREDIAFAIQYLTEQKTIALIKKHIPHPEGKNIALAGGVFANVKLNQRIKEMGFANVFVQPAMDDGGLALGAPLAVLGEENGIIPSAAPTMFLGPDFSNDEAREALTRAGLKYEDCNDIDEEVAELLAQGKVVARSAGRMEFGPRALGNRSILYPATDKNVNDWLNKRLNRTEFMPFAPVTLQEEADKCYIGLKGIEHAAKFMTITVNCTDYAKRNTPAVVHVDGTARPQLITTQDNPGYYNILKKYHQKTGLPTLVNTSFNMHEEPIVATPDDAIRAFVLGHLDALALGNFLVLQQN